MPQNFNQKVWAAVERIPKGKVATYGQIAQILGQISRSRQVGRALHLNRSSAVACHRVVDKNGRLAPNFAFGGWREQKRRLLTEGVKFRDNMHVDLAKCKFI